MSDEFSGDNGLCFDDDISLIKGEEDLKFQGVKPGKYHAICTAVKADQREMKKKGIKAKTVELDFVIQEGTDKTQKGRKFHLTLYVIPDEWAVQARTSAGLALGVLTPAAYAQSRVPSNWGRALGRHVCFEIVMGKPSVGEDGSKYDPRPEIKKGCIWTFSHPAARDIPKDIDRIRADTGEEAPAGVAPAPPPFAGDDLANLS